MSESPQKSTISELRELALEVIGPDDALEPMAAYYHDPEAFRQDWAEKVTPIVLLRLLDIAEAATAVLPSVLYHVMRVASSLESEEQAFRLKDALKALDSMNPQNQTEGETK